MDNTNVVNKISKYLFVLLAIGAVIIVVNVLSIKFKSSRTQYITNSTNTNTTPTVGILPTERLVGEVVDLAVQPDKTVILTVDNKPDGTKSYQLSSNQQVVFYTSSTETKNILIGELQKGNIVRVLKFTNPDRYEISGIMYKELMGKLI